MLSSLARTFAQLTDRRLRRVLLLSIGLSLALIIGLAAAVGLILSWIPITGIEWLDGIIVWIGTFGAGLLALIFFPGTAQIVASLFVDQIAEAVESRHYSDLPTPRVQPLGEVIGESLRFAGLSISLNILALPLYLIPGANLFIFYGLNGYLLGREYAEMVGLRRLDRAGMKDFRRANGMTLKTAGVMIAFLSTLPIINLATPVLATAFAVHEHERLRRRKVAG